MQLRRVHFLRWLHTFTILEETIVIKIREKNIEVRSHNTSLL